MEASDLSLLLKARLYSKYKIPSKVSQGQGDKSKVEIRGTGHEKRSAQQKPNHQMNVLDCIQTIKDYGMGKKYEFFYLSAKHGPLDFRYNPYDLVVVPYEKINSSNYFTLSKEGLVHFYKGVAEHVDLNGWIVEQEKFSRMISIPFIKSYQLRKHFGLWKSGIRREKFNKARLSLKKSLLFDPILQTCLTSLLQKCTEFERIELITIKKETPETLKEFLENQMTNKNYTLTTALKIFNEGIYQLVENCCEESLKSQGFDNQDVLPDQRKSLVATSKRLVYTEQAAKRNACRRLLKFVKMVDYVIIGVLFYSAKSSVNKLVEALTVAERKNCIFESEVLLSNKEGYDKGEFIIVPSSDDYCQGIYSVIEDVPKVLENVEFLVGRIKSISDVDPGEEGVSIDPPEIVEIITSDSSWSRNLTAVDHLMKEYYNICSERLKSFQVFIDMFYENSQTSFSAFEPSTTMTLTEFDQLLEQFEKKLSLYQTQIEQVQKLQEFLAVEKISLNFIKLKNMLLPSPKRCFDILTHLLPAFAKLRTRALISKTENTFVILSQRPEDIDQFVRYLDQLNEARSTMEDTDRSFEQLEKAYAIIRQFNCPISSEQQADWLRLQPSLYQMKDSVDLCEQSRDEVSKRFAFELDRQIQIIVNDSSTLRQKSMDARILMLTSTVEEMWEYTSSLADAIETLAAKSDKFELYISKFQLATTKKANLAEVRKEILLKKLLWASLSEWEKMSKQWKSELFEAFDLSQLTQECEKFSRTVKLLSDGLPSNDVLNKLHKLVLQYSELVPVFSHLRNTDLKQRHWDRIQDRLGKIIIRDATFTVGKVMDLNMLKIYDFIEQQSGQASEESTVEKLIQLIAADWEDFPIPIAPYRQQKDVFILGDCSELLSRLSRCNENLFKIKNSQFTTHIKADIDKWSDILASISDVVSTMIKVERAWLQGEQRFSTVEKRREFPDESRQYAQIDRWWRETMRKISRDSLVLKVIYMHGLLEKLKQVYQNLVLIV